MQETHLVSPGESLEMGGRRNGSAIRERGGVREWKGDAGCMYGVAVRLPRAGGWPSGFVVMEAAPRGLGSGGGSGGKRAESGEGALREPLGGVGVGGARSFACISSRSLRSSS